MRKIAIFVMVSLDGYFEGPNNDLNWHNVDAEFNEFAAEQLDATDVFLLGRKTYDLLASYWPLASVVTNDPIIAQKMNSKPKIVFSTALKEAVWQNTRLAKEVVTDEVLNLKQRPGGDILLLGSVHLAISFIEKELIDEFRIMVNPVVLGDGTILFEGIKDRIKLKHTNTRIFNSGNVLLTYVPDKK